MPDGQITNVPRTLSGRLVKPSLKKNSAFQNILIILYSPLSRPTKKGRIMIVANAGRDAVDAGGAHDESA